jgi:hypothetical protein
MSLENWKVMSFIYFNKDIGNRNKKLKKHIPSPKRWSGC